MTVLELEPSRLALVATEVRKLPAFVRRDFLVAWSYRMSFVSDIANLVGQIAVFYFVGLMVDPGVLPTYGGSEVTYLEFAAVGIAVGVLVQFALDRVATALRGEQLMGTIESVLATPTTPATIQIGAVAFDLIYVPLRTFVFLLGVTLAFGLHFSAAGLLPAAIVVAAFIPFVWGLGVATAGFLLTFRRGSSFVGLGFVALGLLSGVYFPLDLLPGWLTTIAELNPVAIAIESMRDSLLGGESVRAALTNAAIVAPWSAASLAFGVGIFRLALLRERRQGTLGLY